MLMIIIIVLAGKNDRKLSEVKKALASKFDVKYLDKLATLFFGC